MTPSWPYLSFSTAEKKKKVIHNPSNNSTLFVQFDKAKGVLTIYIHILQKWVALSAGVMRLGVAASSLQGGCLHGRHCGDPERRQKLLAFSPPVQPLWVGSDSPADAPRSSARCAQLKRPQRRWQILCQIVHFTTRLTLQLHYLGFGACYFKGEKLKDGPCREDHPRTSRKIEKGGHWSRESL